MFKISTILDVFFWYPLLHLSCGISRLILWPWVSSHPHHSPPQRQHHCPHHGRHHSHKPCGPDPLFTPLGIKLTDSFTGEDPLSNLQNPNWIADGSALCVFLLALLNQHLTMHGEREGNWFLPSTSAPRWVRGVWRVKGERWWKGGVDWFWLRSNFLSRNNIHESRLDCEEGSQRCFL